MGNEVPTCLRGVTGELRKRGGARVRAALGLTDDDDEQRAPKKPKASPLSKVNQAGSQQAGANAGGPPIDPALGP